MTQKLQKKICTSYEPCENCKKSFEGYVILLECNTPSPPTGRYWVVPKEVIVDQSKRLYFVTTELAKRLNLPTGLH